ncbi:MAG: hypothetical protein WAW39_28870 [Prosthecobacter sp.]|uniref:hypothetical protein n=1 Tax=Prosthecobacter sp. TaxID=1965333 RepID=UPI003BB1D4C8
MNLPESESFSSASTSATTEPVPAPGIGSTSNASSGHPGKGIDSSSSTPPSAVSAAFSQGSVLAFGAASDASLPVAGVVGMRGLFRRVSGRF